MREGLNWTIMYENNARFCIRQELNDIFGCHNDEHLMWAIEMERDSSL